MDSVRRSSLKRRRYASKESKSAVSILTTERCLLESPESIRRSSVLSRRVLKEEDMEDNRFSSPEDVRRDACTMKHGASTNYGLEP